MYEEEVFLIADDCNMTILFVQENLTQILILDLIYEPLIAALFEIIWF